MYAVPVIPPDLRHEETIIQAANSLDCLQSAITNIFDRIDKRISKNNVKINELNTRVNSATLKIQNLSGTSKAIKIFSPAKFPSSHIFRDIDLTFSDDPLIEAKIFNEYEVNSRIDPPPNNIQEKLLVFHFRSAKKKSTSAEVYNQRGLGEIPPDLKSVNSILLFNTAENIYGTRKEVGDMNRNQRNQTRSVHQTEVSTSRGPFIEAAPFSLTNRQKGTDRRLQQGLFYTPKLNEAPIIDLPVDLPDLPGIADDIQFVNDDNNQIAPSLFIENLTDLPEIAENIEIKAVKQLLDSEAFEEKTISSVSTHAPIPPPPPAITEVSNVTTIPPPPPPPPPTDSPMSPPKVTQVNQPVFTAASTDVRSNLMDAIRKAGGAHGGRLRAAADVVRQASSEKLDGNNKPKTLLTSGDLMADLHNKLLMRRKGISGAKEGDAIAADNGNVISRLSSLIPPPPVKNQNSSDDDDDDDDADWAD